MGVGSPAVDWAFEGGVILAGLTCRQEVNGKRTALIPHFSNQQPHNALYNIATHSPIYAHKRRSQTRDS